MEGELALYSYMDYIHTFIQDGKCAAYSLRYIHVPDPLFVFQAVFRASKFCFPILYMITIKPFLGTINRQAGFAGVFAITARKSS